MEKFNLSNSAVTAKDYISELKKASKTLTDEAICGGIEFLTKKRIREILTTKTTVTVLGTSYYVSENGNDDADGKTPKTAWKSLARVSSANLVPGDGVFFERGGIYRGFLTAKSGLVYSAYGEGEKPLLCGWEKNSADPALWTETEAKNVWAYSEATQLDVGNIIFNNGEKHSRKIILQYEADGSIRDVRTKHPYNGISDIVDDLSFFHDLESGTVYLRCDDGNPGEIFDDIEMAMLRHVISKTANNVTFDNLCVKYTGSHGLGFGSCKGLTVQNCEFGWIGGSLASEVGSYGRNWATPFGNAIEIYGEAVDYTVKNTYIHDVYDAAITHQSGARSKVHDKNIKYFDNVVENCVYAIEIFVGKHESGENTHEDIYIENNILRKGGGFGHGQRPDTGVTALIRNGGIIDNTNNYVVRNNIFDRSKTRLITAAADGGSKAEYFDNIYVQKKGEMFCTRNDVKYMADSDITDVLVKLGKEHNPTIILTDAFDY